jgi:hypothetical protein
MKRKVIISFISFILSVFAYQSSFSQGFTSLGRNSVKKQLIRFYSKNPVTFILSETDSSITANVTDSSGNNTSRFSYYFNQNNKCYKETGDGACEHCFQKIINDPKMVKRYQWKMISADFYLSKPLWNLALMRTDPEKPFSYSIVKNYLNRNEHRRLYQLQF